MNNMVLDTIKRRRSTRIYREEQIKEEELGAILEAGQYAPSGHGEQPWHFTVIQNQELLTELSDKSKEAVKDFPVEAIRNAAKNENFQVFYHAPTVVVVSGAQNALTPEIDCAAATQNMLLAAESLDIGGCWNGFLSFLFNSEKGDAYRQRLHIPGGYKPYYGIVLGYKAKESGNAAKRKEGAVNYIR